MSFDQNEAIMDISRHGLAIIFLLCFLGGLNFFINWVKIAGDMNEPIVEGHVLARVPCKYDSAPGVDFTIRLDNGVQVHAMTGRYLLNKIPDTVRFHYSGDPRKNVFLFEYQENPLLLCLVCWLGCLLAGLLFWANGGRKRLGNKNPEKMSDETI